MPNLLASALIVIGIVFAISTLVDQRDALAKCMENNSQSTCIVALR